MKFELALNIHNMFSKKVIFFILPILFLGSCVTQRKFEELKDKEELCISENENLKKENETIQVQLTELQANLEDQKNNLDALKNDTTILGTSLRHMKVQYDKINELNELLSSKSSKLLEDAANENRVLLQQLDATRIELQQKEDVLNKLEADLNTKETRLNKLKTDIESREKMVADLQNMIAQKDAAAEELKAKVTKALLGMKDKGLTIEQKNGKVYVGLEANILFPSGSTSIGTDGKKALIDLAKAIEGQSDLEIIVEGHTDTDKLNSPNHPKDNWELSVLRATAVVKIMTDNSNLDPRILSASGRGSLHPVSDDKSKNRRIEIVLSPNLGELFDLIEK